MVTIPRADILQIMERHNDCWSLQADPSAAVVRNCAEELRGIALSTDYDGADLALYRENLAEADDLDALVDRIEREARQ